jgi:hypothetical protein
MSKDDRKEEITEEEDLLELEIDDDFLSEDLLSENNKNDTVEDIIDLVDITEEDIEEGLNEQNIEDLGDFVLDEEKIDARQDYQPESEEKLQEKIIIEEDKTKEAVGDEGLVSGELSGAEDNVDEELIITEGEKTDLPEGEKELEVDFVDDAQLDEELEKLISEEEIEGIDEIAEEEITEEEEISGEILSEAPPLETLAEYKEELIQREMESISEEKLEAVLEKVAGDVLERVAREVIPEVLERVIREEIDILKKDINAEK